jgi:hypothetical protein
MTTRLSNAALIVCLATFLVSPTTRCEATPIIQDVGPGEIGIQFASAVGQTFTALDPLIDTMGIYVSDVNAEFNPLDLSVDYQLYEGAGVGGALLGSRTINLLAGFRGYADVSFAGIPLVVGSVYTLAIVNDDTLRWFVSFADGDPYAGGSMMTFGDLSLNRDLRFHIFPEADAIPVPEPISFVLVGAGLIGAGVCRYRRR